MFHVEHGAAIIHSGAFCGAIKRWPATAQKPMFSTESSTGSTQARPEVRGQAKQLKNKAKTRFSW